MGQPLDAQDQVVGAGQRRGLLGKMGRAGQPLDPRDQVEGAEQHWLAERGGGGGPAGGSEADT